MSSYPLALVAGSSNPELSADIAKYLGVPIGETVLDKFNDGTFFSILDSNSTITLSKHYKATEADNFL